MKKLTLLTSALFMLVACESNLEENVSLLSDFNMPSVYENKWISLNNGAYAMKYGSSYLLEGDIVLTQEQVDLLIQPQTRSGFINDINKRWPSGNIYYTVADDFAKKAELEQAIKHIEGYTHLRLSERVSESDYIEFINDPKFTNSNVGMIGGQQFIRVVPWATWSGIVHEIGHAIGLIHEHSRYDRDDYITVHWDNIPKDSWKNYNKYTSSLSGISNVSTPFDYESIMIYASQVLQPGCVDESKPIITKKDGSLISPTYYLSKEDIISINELYSKAIFIIGEESILLPTSRTYFLLGNAPKYANIQWKVLPKGTANIIKGQGTDAVTLDMTNNMIETLEATVIYPITGEVKKAAFDIRASQAPIVTDINISRYCRNHGDYTLNVLTTDKTATCTWSYEGPGKAEFHGLCYPEDASFLEYPNLVTEVSFYQKGTYDITVNVANQYGTCIYTKRGVYIDELIESNYFNITPNPVVNTNEIEIIVNSKQRTIETYKITIYKDEKVMYESECSRKIQQIDISSFDNGKYKVLLNQEGKVYQKDLHINKKGY